MCPKEIEEIFKRYEHVTKGSHFVWKEYLSGWSKDDKKILTSIKGGAFRFERLKNVCTKRYLYKMEKLTDIELLQIRHFYRDSPIGVKKVNDNFLALWQFACSLSDGFDSPEFSELVDKMRIQTGEDIQSNFERGYRPEIKDDLMNCKESFVGDADLLLDFGLYLFSQFLRTKKQKDRMVNSYMSALREGHPDIGINPSKVWNPLITIMANMAAYTLTCKENLHIEFIKSSNYELITSDQPVINIAKNVDRDYFKFYYPLSPSLGIVFPSDEYEVVEDDKELIGRMNALIKDSSDMFIFKY